MFDDALITVTLSFSTLFSNDKMNFCSDLQRGSGDHLTAIISRVCERLAASWNFPLRRERVPPAQLARREPCSPGSRQWNADQRHCIYPA